MGAKTLQRMHCEGLGDQTLPEIEDSICQDCLEEDPGWPRILSRYKEVMGA